MGSNEYETLWLFVLSCGVFLLEAGRRTENGGGTGSPPPFSVRIVIVEQHGQ